MPGFHPGFQAASVGGMDLPMHALSEPDPSSQVLALAMQGFSLAGRRVLEFGANLSINKRDGEPLFGLFDLITGSDLLDRGMPAAELAALIDRHSATTTEVLIVDPDRGNRAGFRREMAKRGYLHHESPADCLLGDGETYRGYFLRFHRVRPT